MSPATAISSSVRELALAYLAAIVVCGLVVSSSLFHQEPAAAACKIILLLLLILTLYRGSGLLLLFAAQVYLLGQAAEGIDEFTWLNIFVVCVAVQALLIFSLRFRVLLQVHQLQSLTDLRAVLFGDQSRLRQSMGVSAPKEECRDLESGIGPERTHIDNEATSRRLPGWLWPILSVAVGSVITVGLAMTALSLVPADSRAPERVGLMPAALRAIELGCLVMTTLVIVSVFIGELKWRRISPRTARLFVRSSVSAWLSPEFAGIERQRRKCRQRFERSVATSQAKGDGNDGVLDP